MRARETLFIAVTVLGAVAARPASGQDAARDAREGAAAPPLGAVETRVLATYDVTTGRGRPGSPARVTVADSAGALVGSLWLFGDDVARTLAVSVDGAHLVLRGATAAGPMELVLYRQNERLSASLTGRWTIGTARGPLRGRQRG